MNTVNQISEKFNTEIAKEKSEREKFEETILELLEETCIKLAKCNSSNSVNVNQSF